MFNEESPKNRSEVEKTVENNRHRIFIGIWSNETFKPPLSAEQHLDRKQFVFLVEGDEKTDTRQETLLLTDK